MKYILPYHTFTKKRLVKIVFLGDIMQHERQIEYYLKNRYDMMDTFKEVLPILNRADFIVGALESTFGGPPYTYRLDTNQIKFSTPDPFLKVLSNTLNIDLLNLAQNHILDYGVRGLERTVNKIANENIIWLGVKEEDSIKLRIKELPFKFYNYTMVLNTNDKIQSSNGDTVIPFEELEQNKYVSVFPGIENVTPDPKYHNIVCMHWGADFADPSTEIITLAEELLKLGFAAVIGNHSHTPRPAMYDEVNKRIKTFSLGNFISDQDDWRSPYGVPERGTILTLFFDKDGVQRYEEHNIVCDVEPSGKTKLRLGK